MEGHTVRRVYFATRGREPVKTVPRPDAGSLTDIARMNEIQLLLLNDAPVVLAQVKNAGRLTGRPFKTKRRFPIAELEVLLFPAMRARNMETHKMLRFAGGSLNLAGTTNFWGRAADRFGPDRALNSLITQKRWRTFFLDVLIECRQFIITGNIDRFLTVVLGSLTAETPEAATVRESFHAERVIAVFFPIPRRQRQQCGNITDRRLNVRLHKVFGIAVGRQPDEGISLLMLNKIGIDAQQHL